MKGYMTSRDKDEYGNLPATTSMGYMSVNIEERWYDGMSN
jgi:hypothetical protein